MKVTASIRNIYNERRFIYEPLKEHVDRTVAAFMDPRWHYESRIKELESYALKLETGRYASPNHLEDFFGCFIVVENLGAVGRAERLIKNRFGFHERRPRDDTFTSKPSDSFRFDDTRLYVRWKDEPSVRSTGFDGLLFEVQIKTFLAHAWNIATHDLSYKSDEKSWAKERIAFQIKAMLEHAETSILEAQKLAESASLRKTDDLSKRVSAIIQLLNELWPSVSLPKDKKRLAENIEKLIRNVGIDLDSLREILLKETNLGRGTNTLNLSPYSTIVQSLLNQELQRMKEFLTRREREFKIFIAKELELPDSLQAVRLRNGIIG